MIRNIFTMDFLLCFLSLAIDTHVLPSHVGCERIACMQDPVEQDSCRPRHWGGFPSPNCWSPWQLPVTANKQLPRLHYTSLQNSHGGNPCWFLGHHGFSSRHNLRCSLSMCAQAGSYINVRAEAQSIVALCSWWKSKHAWGMTSVILLMKMT